VEEVGEWVLEVATIAAFVAFLVHPPHCERLCR
jgi:hypothetical protein